jgi:hypothetical protein
MGEIEVALFKKKKSCQIILALFLEDVDDFIYLFIYIFTYLLKHLGIKFIIYFNFTSMEWLAFCLFFKNWE